MIDAHVHLERGPYTAEWVDKFIQQAQLKGITELWLLEHSFRFFEFKPAYDAIVRHPLAGPLQSHWLNERCQLSLSTYENLVTATRKRRLPIKVKFGLEICYFPEQERFISNVCDSFPWDFLTGSIHWIDGFGFDHQANIPVWEQSDVNALYFQYFGLLVQAIQSNLFDVIAHPDSIKCFDYYPDMDLSTCYDKVAQAAKDHNILMEFSSGLMLNYGHAELGLNQTFLRVLQEHQVGIITASDAHRPEDVGSFINSVDCSLVPVNTQLRGDE